MRILRTMAVLLAALNVIVWCGVLMTRRDVTPQTGHAMTPERLAAVPAAPAFVEPEAIGIPVRLLIPSIDLDAAVEQVALTADGAMEVPQKPLDTGWYSLGARPGETGSAAISGHVDWLHGATAVFRDLHKVKSGDAISVLDDAGKTLLFVVRETRLLDSDANAAEVFALNDGAAHLNIITCDGTWDKTAGQYTHRLVVFTDRIAEVN